VSSDADAVAEGSAAGGRKAKAAAPGSREGRVLPSASAGGDKDKSALHRDGGSDSKGKMLPGGKTDDKQVRGLDPPLCTMVQRVVRALALCMLTSCVRRAAPAASPPPVKLAAPQQLPQAAAGTFISRYHRLPSRLYPTQQKQRMCARVDGGR
jgi:hypothetical protein